ncbi:penicillin amidase [Tamaricihabitans halophyticus]|uniref:Penicillin amidase n=1 Tax=Tamaricihabitans halophyticus TaxID=1262583 RepID=A0A4V2ST70_9PSEU|nr:penicillin acylase family protein [Tamaricihabitans halophyticus]TCP49296.1 penicillin amidase [Tamaricihabitans halophyticus]
MAKSSVRRYLPATLLATLLTTTLLAPSGTAVANPDGEYAVTGLTEPVELRVDNWGVPHIYANNNEDLFLAQGFNAARDRLFQIDLWHRRGLGLLSEAFGPKYLEQDRAARMFRYRGDMQEEWRSYGPEAKQIATQFANGVNAYLDWLDDNPEALPEEFRKLDYRPSRWQPEDIVQIRSHGLTRNVSDEVDRARIACAAGLEADRVRQKLEPAHQTTIPDGLDPCGIPDDVLDTYDLATQDVEFSEQEGDIVAVPTDAAGFEGSNNWTISGERTETSRPILANDPHRSHAAPSLRYITHLSAPEMDLIGAGEPALPGVSMGHNGTVGFGLTIFSTDQDDLYVYELDPNDPTRYRYGDGWETMRTAEEEVPIAGQEPETVAMSFTRHGPVVRVDEENNRAYAVRTMWLEPGTAPYFGSVRFNDVSNFDEFVEAMYNWGTPSENQVYADVDGNIGWAPGGVTPKRANYDGLLPVPGDGRYEWNGFYFGDEMPRSYNPDAGYVATANEMNLPPEFQDKNLGFEWANPYRFQRISEVLDANDNSSVTDSAELQNDQLSIPARRILALLDEAGIAERGGDSRAAKAATMLRGWDAVESADSAQAALFEVWRVRQLEPAFVKATAPKAAELIERPDTSSLLDALENPDDWFGNGGEAKRDALLRTTLAAGYAETVKLLGPDPSKWQWGDLQYSQFEHPMTEILDEDEQQRFNVGPLPRGGSEHTANASSFDTETFKHTSGASFRMVLDVGEWDNSIAVNTPGQSGNPNDPNYRDLAETWQRGEYFPLSYSRAEVEQNTKQLLMLRPR